jgi:16S rRNA (adenine1518-N6/adenine1519-N6)-dimethyltransferase
MHPKQLLANYGVAPKKSLGQNFLFDDAILAQIVGWANLKAADQVLEIGPGLGSLTRQLAGQAGRVVAVELDDRFLPILQGELADFDNIELLHGDILAQDPAALFQDSYKVVANVPYYITGAILRHLLGAARKPSLLVLTVQKEVAERITAVPPHMSLLAVSVQYYGETQKLKTIRAGAFWPRPDVDSTVVRIDLGDKPGASFDAAAEQRFFRIVRAGFGQKRKQLQNNLRQLGLSRTDVAALLAKSGIDGRRRAETLNLAEWRGLALAFAQAEHQG